MKGQASKAMSGQHSKKKTSQIINNNSNKSIYNTINFQYYTTAKQRGILMSVCNLKNNKKVQMIYTYQSSRFQYPW